MRAILLRESGGPEQLRGEDVAPPEPGPGQVLVKLAAAALNRRDILVRTREQFRAAMPFIPGSDGAGHVAQVGPASGSIRAGDEVVIYPALNWGFLEARPSPDFRILGGPDNGTFAEYICIAAENVFSKPNALSFAEAAALPVAGLTVWRALVTKARLQAGETLLVHGVGSGVGAFALQLAKVMGARVIVTSHSQEKLNRARGLGADTCINYSRDDWKRAVEQATAGAGVDVVVDSVGSATFAGGLDALAPGGRLVTFGTTSGALTEIEIRKLYQKQLTVFGTTLGSPQEFTQLLRAVQANVIRPVVDRTFPLFQVAEAQQYMESQEQFGKIVLTMEPG